MKKIFITAMWIGMFIHSMAQQPDDYILTAAQNNPALKAKYNQYLAALQRVPQAGGLPDPELSSGFFIEPMQRYMGNQVADISLMQMFPWFGTLSAAKTEAALMAKMKYEEFRDERNSLIYSVKESWYALYGLEQQRKFLRENIDILKTFENLALTRYKTGGEVGVNRKREPIRPENGNRQAAKSGGVEGMNMGDGQAGNPARQGMEQMRGGMQETGAMTTGTGMVDVLRVQMQIKEAENELQLMEDEIRLKKVEFNVLLNRQVDEPVSIADTILKVVPPLSMQSVLDTILQKNPMIKMTDYEEDAWKAMERMRIKMSYPMIGIGANYMVFNPRQGAETHRNGMNMFMPMFSLSIPVYRRKYSGAIREAEIMRQSVIEERQNRVNELKVSFHEIINNMNDAERRIELYTQLLAMSSQALDILTTDYKTAGKDFEEVLRMRQQILQYNLERVNAIIKYNTALAMLANLMAK